MRVALTLDDGPSIWTPAILDLLAEAGAHATFFVLGCHIEWREDVLRRMLGDGHDVGNHGWSHKRLSVLSDANAGASLAATQSAIHRVSGYIPYLWRAPHLDIPAWMHTERHVGCDIDTADWMLTDPQRIADAALRAKNGDIILMHDGIPPDGGTGTRSRQPTVDALRIILRQPWEFLTVSELWA